MPFDVYILVQTASAAADIVSGEPGLIAVQDHFKQLSHAIRGSHADSLFRPSSGYRLRNSATGGLLNGGCGLPVDSMCCVRAHFIPEHQQQMAY